MPRPRVRLPEIRETLVHWLLKLGAWLWLVVFLVGQYEISSSSSSSQIVDIKLPVWYPYVCTIFVYTLIIEWSLSSCCTRFGFGDRIKYFRGFPKHLFFSIPTLPKTLSKETNCVQNIFRCFNSYIRVGLTVIFTIAIFDRWYRSLVLHDHLDRFNYRTKQVQFTLKLMIHV